MTLTLRPAVAADAEAIGAMAILAPPSRPLLGSIALIPARDTGLVFYDGCCMCGGCDSVEWSVENITALTAQYRDACELAEAVRDLSGWIDADPPRRVAQHR